MIPPVDPKIQDLIIEGKEPIYFNGFALGVGAGDVILTLLRQGAPVMTLNSSYTVTKTLAKALTNAISEFERTTDHTIMTVEEVKTKIEKSRTENKQQ